MFAKISWALQGQILTFAWFKLFWEDLLRFREVEKLVLGSMHVVLPLELRKRFQSWLILKSPEHGSSAAEEMLSLAVWAVQHKAVLSCVPWNSPRGSSITLDSTRWETDLWWSPLLHRNRSTERPKRRWLTSNTLLVRFWPRTWTFSGLTGMGILSFG